MLTGLPNRAFFYERTEEALARTAAGGSGCAVMLFDLDRFKEINDTMGHRSGDRVLIEVGPRVLEVLRAGDTLARLGGDEFCVLLPTISEETDAVRVAERIIAVLEAPFEMDGASLGIRQYGSRWRRRTGRRPTSCCSGPTWPCTWPRAPRPVWSCTAKNST